MKRQALVFNLANLLILLPLFALSLSVGVAEFHWSRIFSSADSMQLMLISRLPRTFAVVLSGASLAVAGMIMQILMKNRFVEPSMVGASQSAALALLLMMLFAPSVAPLLRMSVGAAAAMAGMLLFMALISRLPPTAQLMVPLVGVIFGGVIESVTLFIAYEREMMQALGALLSGDFSNMMQGRYELLWIGGLAAACAYLIADQLTIAGLGDSVSVNLGLNRTAVLWSGLMIVSLITSLVVVTVGSIPFIGLVVPNIVSRLMGDKLRASLPAVALMGASLVLACDIVGRTIRAPFEIPVSTVFGVVGTVLFLYLLMRKPAHAVGKREGPNVEVKNGRIVRPVPPAVAGFGPAGRILRTVYDAGCERALGFRLAKAGNGAGLAAAGGVFGGRFDPAVPNADQQSDSHAVGAGFRFAVCVFADAAGGGVGRHRLFVSAADG